MTEHDLFAVLVRCRERPRGVLQQLSAEGVPFVVYQKGGTCADNRSKGLHAAGDSLRQLPHNYGRECGPYLRFIVDHYEALPRTTIFLQMGAPVHLSYPDALWPNLAFLRTNATYAPPPFAALSKNLLEGHWPAPCEAKRRVPAFRRCADTYWRLLSSDASPPPRQMRFYANGLFAVARDRILAHPRSLYRGLLEMVEGANESLCGPPATDREGEAETDCLMLEKLWHVLFGEPAQMPRVASYNARVRQYDGRARVGELMCMSYSP